MKQTKKQMTILIVIVAIILSPQTSNAQWDGTTYLPSLIQTFNPSTQAVGIGSFPSFGSIKAALHINTNYTAASSIFPAGNVFSTDCPNASNAAWRQFRGGTEYGDIYTLASPDSNFNVRANFGDLNFITDYAPVRMCIKYTTGLVGIGSGFTTPNFLLDVDGGDIDVNTIINAYRLNKRPFLWHDGDTTSLFIGDGAGNGSNAPPFYLHNVYIGNSAGHVSTTNNNGNVFVGFEAGVHSYNTALHTFVGYEAGWSNIGGHDDGTFIGANSGHHDSTSSGNTYVGNSSGFANQTAGNNTMIGSYAGQFNKVDNNTFVGATSGNANITGKENAFLGSGTGVNNNANANTFIGFNSGQANVNGTQNAFVGYKSGYNNSVDSNTFVGGFSGQMNVTGIHNAFLGASSGQQNTGNNNSFIGFQSGLNNIGSNNTFVGDVSGNTNTNGSNNTFVGSNAGFSNNNASNNTFIGNLSGFSNTKGHENDFLGRNSGYSNDSGSMNVFLGNLSGYSNIKGNENVFVGFASGHANNGIENTFIGKYSGFNNTYGELNTFVGYNSGINNLTGGGNVFVGQNAGDTNTIGQQNTFVGSNTGSKNITGEHNVLLGESANVMVDSLVYATAIGTGCIVPSSFKMILGSNKIHVGIGLSGDNVQLGPQNKLEINAGKYGALGFDPAPPLATPYSGLRFRDMNAGCAPQPNQSHAFLSVDSLGNVIFVKDSAATGGEKGLGDSCNTFTNPLNYDWEIPMRGHNFRFTNQTSSSAVDLTPNENCVGIGNVGCSPLAASLEIIKKSTSPLESQPTSILIKQNTDDDSMALAEGINISLKGHNQLNVGEQIDVAGQYNDYGLYATTVRGADINFAVIGEAANARNTNAGVLGISSSNTGNNFGVVGLVTGSANQNTGVFAEVQGGTTNLGVVAQVNGSSSYPSGTDIAIYGGMDSLTNPAWAGYFDGNVNINGWAICTAAAWVSDAIFKIHLDSITNAISIIKQLKGRYYDFTANNNGMKFPKQRQMGFIAEDVEQVLPALVIPEHKPAMVDTLGNIVTPSIDYKALDYIEFIPLLTRGIQEQSKTIDSLKTKNTKQDSINKSLQNQINQLAAIIDSCCSKKRTTQQASNNNGSNNNINTICKNTYNDVNSISSMDVKLSDVQTVVLNQNQPNPFAMETTITYFLTDDIKSAEMLFYDSNGTLIKSVELTQRGQGQLNVFAQDLTNGLYSYTLVIDGQIFATKKMVKQ